MSRQVLGDFAQLANNLAAANGAPSGNEATRLVMATAFPVAPQSIDWLVWIEITETLESPPVETSCDLHLWGRDEDMQEWGALGNSDGMMNGATSFTIVTSPRRVYFVYQNLGVFQDLYLEIRNITGIVSVDAYVAPIYNCEANGLAGNG